MKIIVGYSRENINTENASGRLLQASPPTTQGSNVPVGGLFSNLILNFYYFSEL